MPSFDWAAITKAAEEWMAEHPGKPPMWLVLPNGTPEEIVNMAGEIYDCPTMYDDVEEPWFTTIAPAEAVIDKRSPMNQPSGKRFTQAMLVELAKNGQLTAEDIGKMSMEEYAQVRGILLAQVKRATGGNPLGFLKKM